MHRVIAPLPSLDPGRGIVVREPERGEPGYWAGCPGVLYEPDRRRFLLSYRQRRPPGSAAGADRGWRCALAASTDGIHFDDIWEVRKDELNTPSMERFSLISAPGSGYQADGGYQPGSGYQADGGYQPGRSHQPGAGHQPSSGYQPGSHQPSTGYHLYISYVDPADNRWRIDVLQAADPGSFAIQSARSALTAAATGTEGVKDPYALRFGPVSYLLASFAVARQFTAEQRQRAHGTGDIYNTGMTTHPTGLATSLDGISFDWHGAVLDVGDGWDRYQSRLTCVVPVGPGYVGFYDGSASVQDNYEERCGIAASGDLWHWRRLTTHRPWIATPHGGGATRYIDAVVLDGEWWIYYEMARADGAHDLRLQRVQANISAPARVSRRATG